MIWNDIYTSTLDRYGLFDWLQVSEEIAPANTAPHASRKKVMDATCKITICCVVVLARHLLLLAESEMLLFLPGIALGVSDVGNTTQLGWELPFGF